MKMLPSALPKIHRDLRSVLLVADCGGAIDSVLAAAPVFRSPVAA